MLWRAEVKKILLVRKGLLLLAVCLFAKILFLCVYPEMKDPRISLSQNQYNKYLNELYGESTPEKNSWIMQEYAWCRETIERQDKEGLERAYLHRNAAQIFSEKAAEFEEQEQSLAPACYIYEYGWQTIFSLQRFPDVFLLFGLLALSAQCFTSEQAAGMLPILLSARNGKSRLFFAKLLALLLIGAMAALLFSGTEVLVFCLRGWCNDGQAPTYSVSVMKECALPLSLSAGYGTSLLIRALAALLFSAVVYGLSVWIRNPINTVFAGMCLLSAPLLLHGSAALFTHGGLLCGARVLNMLEPGMLSILLPFAVVIWYSMLIVLLSLHKYNRGV